MISRNKPYDFIDIPWSIWVKSRITPYSSHSSSMRIHNDSRSIICSGSSDAFFECFHESMLDIWIDSEVEIDTFDFLLRIFIKYWSSETVSSLILTARFSSESIMKIPLNSKATYPISINKTYYLCKRWSFRILTNRVIHEF